MIAYMFIWLCCTGASIGGMLITGKASCLWIMVLAGLVNYHYSSKDDDGYKPMFDSKFTPESRGFRNGMKVQHFKRETLSEFERTNTNNYLYEIIETDCTHTETKEPLVIYRALYGDRKVYARPMPMFCSKVDKEKYPDIKQEFRLTPLTDLDVEK